MYWHSDQQILAGRMYQKLFDQYHKQLGCWVASSGYFFLFDLKLYQHLTNQNRLGKGAFHRGI
jgi:hypothetical protein